MTARAINKRQFEERDSGSNAPMMILTAVAMFGLAILFLYIIIAEPQPGTSMEAIRNTMSGLGGDMSFLLPLMLAWMGGLCIASTRGKNPSVFVNVCDALLFVCLFTAVHMFFVETISRDRMTIQGFANFVSKSYGYGRGGGAIGALLSWPLYRNLGVAGGFIATLLIATLLLVATGRMGRLVRYIGSRAEQHQSRREIEHQFDKKRAQPARREARRVHRDPYSEVVMGGSGVPLDIPARKPTRGRPARPAAAPADGMEAKPAVAVNQPVRRRRPPAGEMEGVRETQARRPKAAAAEPRAAARRAPAASPIAQSTPRRKKKLYNEDMAKTVKQPAGDELFDSFDDFDRLEAESAAFDQAEKQAKPAKARKNAFKPDRPSILKEEAAVIENCHHRVGTDEQICPHRKHQEDHKDLLLTFCGTGDEICKRIADQKTAECCNDRHLDRGAENIGVFGQTEDIIQRKSALG